MIPVTGLLLFFLSGIFRRNLNRLFFFKNISPVGIYKIILRTGDGIFFYDWFSIMAYLLTADVFNQFYIVGTQRNPPPFRQVFGKCPRSVAIVK